MPPVGLTGVGESRICSEKGLVGMVELEIVFFS